MAPGGAGGDAAGAIPAVIAERTSQASSSRVVRISARKNQVPSAAVDLHGGFAIPAEAGGAGEVAFEHRAGIDVGFVAAAEGLQLEHRTRAAGARSRSMVVIVPGIAGDADSRRDGLRKRLVAGEIIQRQADDGLAAGQHLAGVAAALRRALRARPCRRGCLLLAIRGTPPRGWPRPRGRSGNRRIPVRPPRL